MSLVQKIIGDLNSKEVKKLDKIAEQVLALEPQMADLSDDELRAKTAEFKDRHSCRSRRLTTCCRRPLPYAEKALSAVWG